MLVHNLSFFSVKSTHQSISFIFVNDAESMLVKRYIITILSSSLRENGVKFGDGFLHNKWDHKHVQLFQGLRVLCWLLIVLLWLNYHDLIPRFLFEIVMMASSQFLDLKMLDHRISNSSVTNSALLEIIWR